MVIMFGQERDVGIMIVTVLTELFPNHQSATVVELVQFKQEEQ